MTSTVPEREPLGASTLNRDWLIDVNTGTAATPTWTPVCGITEFQPGKDTTLQEDSDFDGGGWQSQTATALAWTLAFKVSRKLQQGVAAYDPGQEALRLASDELGTENSVHVRFYKMDAARAEAYEGYAAVGWNPDGGGMDALDMVSVELTGQGKRSPITHPAPAAP